MTEHIQTAADIEVHVTFATALKPFNHQYPANTAVQTVLQDTLSNFKITADGTTRYFFVYDGNEVSAEKTIGSLVDHGHSLKLSLRTETISG